MNLLNTSASMVSTHSRLKAAGVIPVERNHSRHVSTHSRLKAAGMTIVKF